LNFITPLQPKKLHVSPAFIPNAVILHEEEKKRPDKHIGIMITPLALFFRYNSNTPPGEEWFKKATEITDENVQQLLKLKSN
jgi:hypothetical protein